ncbi:MAG: histidine ammonia-lyase [Chlamydiales bacterium]
MPRNSICLNGQSLTLKEAESIADGSPVEIAPSCIQIIEDSRSYVERVANQEFPVYGINTGFGYFANTRVEKKDLELLQENIIKSHAAGQGPPLSIPETRLMMALRLNVLLKGFTGVRKELCFLLRDLINKEMYPIVPQNGSVGASGDLAPLAHLALPLIGLGQVSYRDQLCPAHEALQQEGLKPLKLEEKEGLGLINGTQAMLAVGSLSLVEGFRLFHLANRAMALTFEGMNGNISCLNPLIHQERHQKGQIKAAQEIRDLLADSEVWDGDFTPLRLQDPYSLRCTPQVHGPSLDVLNYAKTIIENELNAATDNPLVFVSEESIVSGGNFHGQALALPFDFCAIGLSELSNISERRLELLLNPHSSQLPAFLSPHEGLESGYMALQYLAASLVNQNKHLANPNATDSIPGNVGVEDHVSMGMNGAIKLRELTKNLRVVLTIELIVAAQAIDMRGRKRLGKGTKKIYECVRSIVPYLDKDRIPSEDVALLLKNLEPIMEIT